MSKDADRYRERVEQAIARGWSEDRIIREYPISRYTVGLVRDRMDEAIAVKDKPVKFGRLRPIDHGTHRGFVAHRNRGEYACTRCMDGEASWLDERRETRRLQAKARREKKAA